VDRDWRVGSPSLNGEGEAQERHCGYGKGEKRKGDCEEHMRDDSGGHFHDVDEHGHTVGLQDREH